MPHAQSSFHILVTGRRSGSRAFRRLDGSLTSNLGAFLNLPQTESAVALWESGMAYGFVRSYDRPIGFKPLRPPASEKKSLQGDVTV